MLITFSITQNQEPIQNLLKGGKAIFFFSLLHTRTIPGCWFFFSKRFRVVSDKIGHKLQILSET